MAAVTGTAIAGASLYTNYQSTKRASDEARDGRNAQIAANNRAIEIEQERIDEVRPIINNRFNDAENNINLGAGKNVDIAIDSANKLSDISRQGYGDARSLINNGYEGVINTFRNAESQYQAANQQGDDASYMQAAMSGALGPETQAQALSQFNNDPGQQFVMDEVRKQMERGAASSQNLLNTGTQAALQDRLYSLAQNNYNNRFSQLGQIADRGLTAKDRINQIRSNIASSKQNRTAALASLQQNKVQNESGIQANLAQQLMGITGDKYQNLSALDQNEVSALANLITGNANNMQQLAQNEGAINAGYNAFRAQQPSFAQQTISSLPDIMNAVSAFRG